MKGVQNVTLQILMLILAIGTLCCFNSIGHSWNYFHSVSLSSESFQFHQNVLFIVAPDPLPSALRAAAAAAASRFNPSGAGDKNIQKVAASFISRSSGEGAQQKSRRRVQGSNCIVNLNYPLLYDGA